VTKKYHLVVLIGIGIYCHFVASHGFSHCLFQK